MTARTCGSPLCAYYHAEPMEVRQSIWRPNDVIRYTNHYCFREASPVLRTTTLDETEYPVACAEYESIDSQRKSIDSGFGFLGNTKSDNEGDSDD